MKHFMMAIYDQAAGAYLPPWTIHNLAMARRAFGDCVNDPNHKFHLHPADYTLFNVAVFDDNTGSITDSKIVSCGNGVEYIQGNTDAPVSHETPILRRAAGGDIEV